MKKNDSTFEKETLRDIEDMIIKAGVNRFAREEIEELQERARKCKQQTHEPPPAGADLRPPWKVRSRKRRYWKVFVPVAAVVGILVFCTLQAGALPNMWNWFSVQMFGDAFRFQSDTSDLKTSIGTPAADEYAKIAQEVPDIQLLIPGWLPEGAVLDIENTEWHSDPVKLYYKIGDNYLMLKAGRLGKYQSKYSIIAQDNEGQSDTVEVLGMTVPFTWVKNEAGLVNYTAVWNSNDTYYALVYAGEADGDFKQIMTNLKVYS